MADEEVFKKFGKFTIAPGRELDGELRVAGKQTSLYVRDGDTFDPLAIPDGCVVGTLHDLTKVTLVQCIGSGVGSAGGADEHFYYASLFPHFVVEGRKHLDPHESNIEEIRLVIEDAASLFYDFDAFHIDFRPGPVINQLIDAQAKKVKREIAVGPEGIVAYYTGKRVIVEADTTPGSIRAEHIISGNLIGGPHGIKIDSTITLIIVPSVPVVFKEAIRRTSWLIRFLDLIIGRPQNVVDLSIEIGTGEQSEMLKVHWSFRPTRYSEAPGDERTPHPADTLLNPILRAEEFSGVMHKWFAQDHERRDARHRFHTLFSKGRS